MLRLGRKSCSQSDSVREEQSVFLGCWELPLPTRRERDTLWCQTSLQSSGGFSMVFNLFEIAYHLVFVIHVWSGCLFGFLVLEI